MERVGMRVNAYDKMIEKREATNVMIFKYIHWHSGISNSFLHPPLRSNSFSIFSFFAGFEIHTSRRSRAGNDEAPSKVGHRKQHEIQIKSFQKASHSASMAQQVFKDGVCVFLKWLMGMKSSFLSVYAGICAHTHMCSFLLMNMQKPEPLPCALIKALELTLPASALLFQREINNNATLKPASLIFFPWKKLSLQICKHESFTNIAKRRGEVQTYGYGLHWWAIKKHIGARKKCWKMLF